MLIRPAYDIDCSIAFKNDFEAVAGLNYQSVNCKIDVDDPWNEHIGISPQDAFDILTQDLPYRPSVVIRSSASGKISIDIEAQRSEFGDSRSIMGKEIQAGNMTVDGSFKGHNIGKTLFRNYVEFGVHTRLHGFHVRAGNENGGHVWARAGVPLLQEQIDDEDFELRRTLEARLERVAEFLTPLELSHAQRVIQLDNIYANKEVADLHYVLPEEAAQTTTAVDVYNFCKERRLDFTLGRYLMNGVTYDAYLSFYDDIAMPLIESYVGGFNSIELTYPHDTTSSQSVASRRVLTA